MCFKFTVSHTMPEDSEKLVEYLNEVGGETDNLSFKQDEFHYSTEEEKDFIENVLRNKNGVMLVAKDKSGNIVGESTCISNGRRSSHVFTLGLTVKKKYWGNGIGTTMIEQVINRCLKLKCEKIMLQVFHTNIRAIKLYKKLGFKLEGTLKKDAKINNTYVDAYVMCKFLEV